MEIAKTLQPRPLRWAVAFFAPLAVALVLLLITSFQKDIHRWSALPIVANLLIFVAMIAQGAFYVVVRKWTWWGIAVIIFGSAGLGFGLHVLLRAL